MSEAPRDPRAKAAWLTLQSAAGAMVSVWDKNHGPAIVRPVMGAELEALRAALKGLERDDA